MFTFWRFSDQWYQTKIRCILPLGHWPGLPWSGKKLTETNFFPGQGKIRELVDGHGNLERTWGVREKSGNLKINGPCSLQK